MGGQPHARAVDERCFWGQCPPPAGPHPLRPATPRQPHQRAGAGHHCPGAGRGPAPPAVNGGPPAGQARNCPAVLPRRGQGHVRCPQLRGLPLPHPQGDQEPNAIVHV